jgi:hypothetical protein
VYYAQQKSVCKPYFQFKESHLHSSGQTKKYHRNLRKESRLLDRTQFQATGIAVNESDWSELSKNGEVQYPTEFKQLSKLLLLLQLLFLLSPLTD